MNDSISNESPPTWHGLLRKMFGVNLKAAHGNRYIGLVVRENGSLESIAQKLFSNLKKEVSYQFSFQISHSKNMVRSSANISLKESLELKAG